MAKKDKKKDKPAKEHQLRKPGDLQSEVTRASRAMRTFLTNSLSNSGIYAGQDGVILALAEEDGLSAGTIADMLGVKPPTMTRTLTRMEAQGFIKRQADTVDGRQMRALLTDEGRRHVGAIQLAVRGTENLALADLTEKEVRQFLKVLRKINRNLGLVEPEAEASSD